MRIGILGDSHGAVAKLERAVEALGPVNMLLHTGDYLADARDVFLGFSCPSYVVLGNNDRIRGLQGPDTVRILVDGHYWWMEHGDMLSGMDEESRASYARHHGASVLITGHTHVPRIRKVDGVWLVNPGAVNRARGDEGPTCVLAETDGDDVKFSLIHL
jgi:putative phosphoesterase